MPKLPRHLANGSSFSVSSLNAATLKLADNPQQHLQSHNLASDIPTIWGTPTPDSFKSILNRSLVAQEPMKVPGIALGRILHTFFFFSRKADSHREAYQNNL
jgi:hypothetical protein